MSHLPKVDALSDDLLNLLAAFHKSARLPQLFIPEDREYVGDRVFTDSVVENSEGSTSVKPSTVAIIVGGLVSR
ncbi:MAG: hypothetical protein ABI684_10515 [Nitrospirota bacterium]